MSKPYVCSVCGREHVKLWRPYMDTELLICATCAEERQIPQEYDECIWRKQNDGSYMGTPTGCKLPFIKWKVNEEGLVPSSCFGPGPDGQFEMTDQLIVNLRDVSKSYSSGNTTIVAAVPTKDGNFFGYTSVSDEGCKWWSKLPTR